ncbi:MAG: beta-N-acetylhexosaminidase [Candidatus Parcubacteria bacterium]|nr:beta-N-acetylhexosaminidase [Burkholderiales bacterium]
MRRIKLPLGTVVLDPTGPALTEDDRRRLQHPAAGGVILFSHNYVDSAQLRALTEEIAGLRDPALPICVDHEGGRVQRFKADFTEIPPMRRLGVLWDRDREGARRAARAVGTVIAAELGSHGVDFSFTPVLDLDYGSSAVIGHRAFHYDPNAVGTLAAQLIEGLAGGGMAAVGKHFPGHGFAAADSHVALPADDRPAREIFRKDLVPYEAAIKAGLAAIMPAHVVYAKAAPEPAGYSTYWLQEVLRGKLGFQGLIFSDDLSMEGAVGAGDVPERARAALTAGCDQVLLCQKPQDQEHLLESLASTPLAVPERVERMRRKGGRDFRKSVAYREALATLQEIP